MLSVYHRRRGRASEALHARLRYPLLQTYLLEYLALLPILLKVDLPKSLQMRGCLSVAALWVHRAKHRRELVD